jgi:hypothetical protein
MSGENKGMSKGCMIVLVIVSSIILLIIALSIVCYVKKDSILEWGLVKMTTETEAQVVAAPPDSVTAEQIHSITANFTQKLKDKKINTAELSRLALFYQEIWKDKKIDTAEGRLFLKELEKFVNPMPVDSTIESDPVRDSVPVGDSL